MKRGWITGILTVAVLAMAIGGTTLAWFTATASAPVNTFTAGTVIISAGRQEGAGHIVNQNWNPGDTDDFDLEIINNGTKAVYIRAHVDMKWLPKQYRLFVVYTGDSVQLLALEWNQGNVVTSEDGTVAIGKLHIGYPSNSAYIDGTFSQLSNEDIFTNDTTYNVWCIDHWTSINKNTIYNNVKVFDPISNPDWYNEVDVQDYWESIPMSKIAFIINQNYISKGYTVDEIQQAVWHYTNNDGVTGKALEIVQETEVGHDLPTNNVTFTLGDNWIVGLDGYYYYKSIIQGSFKEISQAARTIVYDAQMQLDGDLTGDQYQGRTFVTTVFFEAVQSSNNAVDSAWPQHPYNTST